MDGCSKTLWSIFVIFKLSVYSSPFTPKLSWFWDLSNLLSPNSKNLQDWSFQANTVNPFRDESSRVWPSFWSFQKDIVSFLKTIVKIILPITEVVLLKFFSSQIPLSIHLKNCKVIVCLKWINYLFGSDKIKKYVSQSFIAASSRSTEIFCCKVWLLQKIFVPLVFLLIQYLCNLQIQFVFILAWNTVYIV